MSEELLGKTLYVVTDLNSILELKVTEYELVTSCVPNFERIKTTLISEPINSAKAYHESYFEYMYASNGVPDRETVFSVYKDAEALAVNNIKFCIDASRREIDQQNAKLQALTGETF